MEPLSSQIRGHHPSIMSPRSEALVARTETVCDGSSEAQPAGVLEALRVAVDAPDYLLPGQRITSTTHYARQLPRSLHYSRNRVAAKPEYACVANCIRCGYAVVAGALHEDLYLWIPSGRAVRSSGGPDRMAGFTRFGMWASKLSIDSRTTLRRS